MPTTITNPIVLDETGRSINEAIKEIASAIHSGAEDEYAIVYGFHINSNESDPSAAVTYLEDAAGKAPAYMDYVNNKFNWGSWKDAFFMPRPCMVTYSGTVDYYLDPNDYNKKEDGTPSALADRDSAIAYQGNAMMEWGRSGWKIWTKVVPDNVDPTSGSIYISNKQVDSSYTAYPFINNQGSLVDHFYTAIYDGSITAFKDSSNNTRFRLRSIPYMPVMNTKKYNDAGSNRELIPYEKRSDGSIDGAQYDITASLGSFIATTINEEVALAYNNNLGLSYNTGSVTLDDANNTTRRQYVLWNTEVLCDIQLINNLLILIGKSLDTQTVFGNGNMNGGSGRGSDHYCVLYTGSRYNKSIVSEPAPEYDMNQKGLFWGSNNDYSCVKVFGMENWWGNHFKRYLGHINKQGVHYIKQTYGTEDGSSAMGYNLTSSNYINTDLSIPVVSSGNYIKQCQFSIDTNTLLPFNVTGGSSNTYYCDYLYANNASTYIASHGSMGGNGAGAFCSMFKYAAASYLWNSSSSLSFKPIA